MTSQHDIDPNSLIMGTGARSAKFTNFGDKVSGTIMSFKARQQTDIKGTPKTYDDGNPMMQVVITLLTELVEDDEDDSLRSVYAKGQMLNAIRTAVVKAGARGLADGGRLCGMTQTRSRRSGASVQPSNTPLGTNSPTLRPYKSRMTTT
jgi:hypothetical protein